MFEKNVINLRNISLSTGTGLQNIFFLLFLEEFPINSDFINFFFPQLLFKSIQIFDEGTGLFFFFFNIFQITF